MATEKRESRAGGTDSALGIRANREAREIQAESHSSRQMDSPREDSIATRRHWVTGTFADRDSAERAYNLMLSRGYDEEEINLLMSDETRQRFFSDEEGADRELGNKALESAGVGGAIGVTAGAILAAVVAIGTSIAIPGIGLVIAGPIAVALAGAGAGGLTGGIIGALIGWGIPEEQAKLYENDLKNGGIILGVMPRNEDDAAYFEGEWKAHNSRNIQR